MSESEHYKACLERVKRRKAKATALRERLLREITTYIDQERALARLIALAEFDERRAP